jgi:glycosyltransferase involved in cell wall biosynthesis
VRVASGGTPLRLALFTDTYAPQVNGVARTLQRLAEVVTARGGAVRVFTTDDPEGGDAEHVVRFPGRAFWAYPQLRLAWPPREAVRRAVSDFAPTLVHVATEFGVGLAGRRVAHDLGLPLVTSYHTNFTSYAEHYHLGFLAQPGWQYLKWFHGGAARTFCPTHAIRRELEGRGFANVALWSRGVDGARFAPAYRSAALRAQLGADNDTVVVGYIGRLALEKGLPVAVEAMRQVMAAHPGRVRFLVGGDGPYEEAMRAIAPAGTTFLGRLEGTALSEAFASCDLFLFPSTTDTFGNVLLEAMASGVPVMGADVGPTRELLAPGRGWLVPPGDARALAERIAAVVSDPDALREAAARAFAFAATQRWEAVWTALLDDYARVIADHAASRALPHDASLPDVRQS